MTRALLTVVAGALVVAAGHRLAQRAQALVVAATEHRCPECGATS